MRSMKNEGQFEQETTARRCLLLNYKYTILIFTEHI